MKINFLKSSMFSLITTSFVSSAIFADDGTQPVPPGGCQGIAAPSALNPTEVENLFESLYNTAEAAVDTSCTQPLKEGVRNTVTLTDLGTSGYYGKLTYQVVVNFCQLVQVKLYKTNGETTCVNGCPKMSDALVAYRKVEINLLDGPNHATPPFGKYRYSIARMSESTIITTPKSAITGTCEEVDVCKTRQPSANAGYAFYAAWGSQLFNNALAVAARDEYTGAFLKNPLCSFHSGAIAPPTADFCDENYTALPTGEAVSTVKYSYYGNYPFAIDAQHPANTNIQICHEGEPNNGFDPDINLLQGLDYDAVSMKHPIPGTWVSQ